MLKFIGRHKFITFLILAALIGGGYYYYKQRTVAPAVTRYVLGAVEKGTLVTSVAGTGQVAVSDQVDIKPKVSGDVTAVNVVQDQEVKEGAALVYLDSRDARAAVTDAEIALESAKIKLDDLIAQPDAQSVRQAENSLDQALRDLDKAQTTYAGIDAQNEKDLTQAYEDGYNTVSASFYKLSDYMTDLRDALGTSASEDEYVTAYKLLLGERSTYIQQLLDDYAAAKTLYDTNSAFFRTVIGTDDREAVKKLIVATRDTAKPIYRALESARRMYDAIVLVSYTQYRISATIDKMQPKIENDVTSAASVNDSLQQAVDKIDTTIEDAPGKVTDAKLAVQTAEQNVLDRTQTLTDLKKGADPLDIRTQQNVVAQQEAALRDAREKLSDYSVRAPFDGVIAVLAVKKGDSVSSGSSLATLITKQHIAEISLNEVDAVKVKLGQKATISFDAIEGLTLTGTVQQIDTLGTVSQGVVNYAVKIGFDTQDDRVKPGMTLSTSVITEAKTDVLMAPNSAVKSSANGNYVEILDDAVPYVAAASGTNGSASSGASSFTSAAGPRQQAVEIGLSNDTMTEIVVGLKEGDKVISSTIKSSSTAAATTSGGSIFGAIGGSRPQGGAAPAGNNAAFRMIRD